MPRSQGRRQQSNEASNEFPKACVPLSGAAGAAGVLQVEAMAQLGGIVMMDPEDQAAKKNFFFGGIEGCKFRRPVVPGDTLVGPPDGCVISPPRGSRGLSRG